MTLPLPVRLAALFLAGATTACETVIPEDTVLLGRRLLVNEQAACALDRTGVVYCWGSNGNFQEYGAPALTLPPSRVPVAVPVPRLYSLADGVGTHFCGIDFEDAIVCWGRGTFGQLGRGFLGEIGNGPGYVAGEVEWRHVTLGRITTCALARDGTAYCWGPNQRGEIGVDTIPIFAVTTVPRPVVNGDVRFRDLAAGWRHACGIATTGATFCWGNNTVGELGNGVADTLPRRVPTLIAGGHAFTTLALSARHGCGIDEEGVAWCWGNNQFGQLGDGTTTDRHEPTRVSGNTRFAQIVTASGFASLGNTQPPMPRAQGGVAHTCALTATGDAFCWGWNGNGQLGDGSTTNRLIPVAVAGGVAFDEIGAGGTYTCGRRGDGVWCWGGNFAGQLGNGSVVAVSTPTQVAAPFNQP